MKKYAIYCSGNASRLTRFFSFEENRIRYRPSLIIYDGENELVKSFLISNFNNEYVQIETNDIPNDFINKKNQYTSNLILDNLEKSKIDIMLCFGSRILKKPLIDIYKERIINFHPSLLPSFKGLNAIDQAIKSGVSIIGNTAHFVDEGIDTGKIILQSAMTINDFADYEDILELQFPMMKKILKDIIGFEVSNVDFNKEISERKKPYLISAICII